MKLFKALIVALVYFSLSTSPVYATINVGTVLFYPPFVTADGSGFDIQFIQTLCQRLQETCEFQPMELYKLYKAVDAGTIDLAIGGITISSGGTIDYNYVYSLPYVLSKGMFLTLQKNSIHSIQELQDKKVGIVRGSRDGDVFYDYLTKTFPQQFEVVQYDRMEDLIMALVSDDIAAAFTHESTVNYWQLNGGNQFKTLGAPMIVGDGIGILASPKNNALIQRVNVAIQKIEQEKYYLNLYTTYFANET